MKRLARAPLWWLLLLAAAPATALAQEPPSPDGPPGSPASEPALRATPAPQRYFPDGSRFREPAFGGLLLAGPVLGPITAVGIELDAGLRYASLMLRYTARLTGQFDQPYVVFQGGRADWLWEFDQVLDLYLGGGLGTLTWHFSDRPMVHTWGASLELGLTQASGSRMMGGIIGLEVLIPGKGGGPDPPVLLVVASISPAVLFGRQHR
jgi:hypothetical protein